MTQEVDGQSSDPCILVRPHLPSQEATIIGIELKITVRCDTEMKSRKVASHHCIETLIVKR